MTENAVKLLNMTAERAGAHAPHLRLLMQRFPAELSGFSDALPDIDPSLPVRAALRHAKGQLALRLALGDLAGVFPLETVVRQLSAFADVALNMAVRAAILEHVPGADPIGFAVISLGKHGGEELNYSSDIDPIFLFDPATLPRRPREEPAEAAVRIGRRVLDIMQARDGDGYVFRVDLRLRPSPEVTPIVLSVGAAISYYEASALPWERAAFIRARACAGDIGLGRGFLEAIRPFVWRRGLDFGAVAEIRGMTHRIRDHYARGQDFGPGFDVKRGRGGIREVEFYTQIHQLIHGGRDASLRSANTLLALAALGERGIIEPGHAEMLASAYQVYRTIEHRLQMVDDQQTHSLPTDAKALDAVARLHGLNAGKDLLHLLAPHVDRVGTLYDALDEDAEVRLPQEQGRLSSTLAEIGHEEADFLAERIARWRSGTYRALRTPAAQTALEAVLPRLVKGFAQAPDPRTASVRLDTMIERLPSALNMFRLLEARPQLLDILINILCLAPTLAGEVAQRTQLLDGLIDATAFDLPASVNMLTEQLAHDDPDADLELTLDRVRHEVGEKRFALGVQLIEAIHDPLDVAQAYGRIAEAAVKVVAQSVERDFARQYGRVASSDFIILALGRMGGAELTHASDLDLIYLFSGRFDAESNGTKPLGATQYYNRLAQRVTAGLSVQTAAGPLYEVDTRLRPSGADGLLAVSLDAFAKYQREKAWTWEHMALTRARVIYGPAERVNAIVADVLKAPRDPVKLVSDAAKMRADMAIHKPAKGALDVKLGSGGLVDLEFCVHLLQLRHGIGLCPQLSKAIAVLVEHGLLPVQFSEAYRLMTRLLVTLRLVAPDLDVPDMQTRALVARSCGTKSWDDLLEQLARLRQSVAGVWEELSKIGDWK